jgi:hypothetical protein
MPDAYVLRLMEMRVIGHDGLEKLPGSKKF